MSSTTMPNPANGSFPSRSSRLSTGCWRSHSISRRYTFVRFFNLCLTNLLPLDAWSDMHQALMSAGKAWMFKASRVQRWLHNGHFITTRPRSDPPQRGGEKVGSTHQCSGGGCRQQRPRGINRCPFCLRLYSLDRPATRKFQLRNELFRLQHRASIIDHSTA